MTKLLYIAVGGALGSVLRYLVAGWGQRLGDALGLRYGSAVLPIGTLLVNVAGCFAIGFLAMALTGPWLIGEHRRAAIVIGLLGGFTTFSTFGYETFSLSNDRQYGWAVANVVLSVTLGLVAVWLGYRLAQRWPGV